MTHYQPVKRLFSRAAMMLLMMLLTTSTAWAQFSGGDGSENNPYEIASYDDLLTLRNNVNNGERYGNCYFRQTADIDWPEGTTWERGIGYSNTGSHYFRGRYDGNGNKIIGFRLTTSEQNAGLFGYVFGDYHGTDATNNVIAEVKNVVLVDPVVTAQATSGEQYVGTLVGYVDRCVKIDDNTVIGGSVTITGVSNNDNSVYAGGLVGYYFNGDWPSLKRNIVSGTTVSGAGVSGGLVGRLYFSYCVDQNFVDATVSSVQHTGDAGTFYRQGAVVGECYSISNNSNNFTWGYYHNTAGLTFFAKDANGNTKNDQLKTSRIYAVGIVPSDITVSGDGHHSFCDKHYCHGGASITLSGGTNPGYLVSGYTSSDVTITNGAFTMPAKDITVSATFTPDPAHFEQTGTNEYTIHSAEGWGVFCDLLANSNKGYFTGKTVKLGNDIQISRAAGLDQHDFTGTFDGQGNTITLAFGTSQNRYTEHAAVFRNTEWASSEQYAKIQNLNVNGTIYTASNVIYDAGLVAKAFGGLEISNCTSNVIINTSNQFAGGFVGYNQGKLNIVNCRSNATVYSTVNGDGTHGGFVGNHHSGELTIEGCVFTGKLLTTATNSTAYCGGFVGWCNTATTIKNCLYAPAIIDTEHGETEVQAGTGDYTSCTFGRKSTATVTITNSYYTRTLGTAQGKQARTVEAGENVSVSLSGMATEYNVSGITAYKDGETQKPGLLYNGTIYAGSDDQVSLTLSHADRGGYTFTDYAASAGTLDGTTLTMPDQNVTINANYESIKFTQDALSYECTSGTEVKMTACDKSATSVTIPATVTYDEVAYTVTAIGNAAFDGCISLTTVFMEPTTPPTLGNGAFANCDELANIYVPAGTAETYKTTGNWATYKDIIQTGGTCGDNVYWSYDSDSKTLTIFGTGAMEDYNDSYRPWESYYKDITTIVIRNGVTTIGDKAFYECTALSSIDLPASLTTIGYNAFSLCYSLSSIELPTSLTTICEYAFEACSGLTSITIPASVTRIDSYAFARCYGLSAFVVDNGNTAYAAEDGVLFNKDKTTLHIYPNGNNRDTYTIPASVTRIANHAFAYCTSLTTVFMQPTTPPTLGNGAFANCYELANIYVPAASLDDYKAAWAYYASKIQGYDGTCGDNVYWSYDSDSKTLTIFGTGAMADYDSCFSPWEVYCEDITTANISNGVTSIGKDAFYGCTAMTSVTIPNSVTTIDNGAFYGCGRLASIDIPDGVTSIGDGAFSYCDGLTNTTIPASVTSIGAEAFFECTNLTEVIVQRSDSPITQLGDIVFYHCSDELTIYVPIAAVDDYKAADNWSSYADKIKGFGSCGNNVYWSYDSYNETLTIFGTGAMADYDSCFSPWKVYCEDITTANISNGVTNIGKDALYGCTAMTSVTIPNSVTTIDNGAFIYCGRLASIDIPDGVTTIGDGAFSGCTGLTSITIPASVTSIGAEAFFECTNLTEVIVQRSDSPITQLGDIVFYHCSDELTIYVPAAAVDDYKAAWAYYASKIQGYDGTCGDNVYWSYDSDSYKLTIFGTGAMADYNDSYRPWETYRDEITTVDIRAGVTSIGEYNQEIKGKTNVEIIPVSA